MDKAKSIAVIGAGIVGAQIALRLQVEGNQVVLYDPEPPGMACSFGNGGYIATDEILPLARPQILAGVPRMLRDPLAPFTVHWPCVPGLVPWFLRFARACTPKRVERGIKVMDRLMKATPQAWDEAIRSAPLNDLVRAKGFMRIFETQSGRRRFTGELAVQQDHGVPVEELDGEGVRAHLPGLTPAVTGGLFYPEGRHLADPHRVVERLVTAFKKRGGVFERQEIVAFSTRDSRLIGVRTARTRQRVQTAVIAAGIQSRKLLREFGLDLPLTAERGYHVMMEGSVPGMELPFVPVERGMIITPLEAGTRFGGTVEFAAPGLPPTPRRADRLLSAARELFAEIEIIEKSRWMGERPTLPDYLPAIGPVEGIGNLFVATGHQHLGVTLSAVTAGIISEMIAGRFESSWEPLSPNRF